MEYCTTDGIYTGPIPEGRLSIESIGVEYRGLLANRLVAELIESFPHGCVVLNEYRQVLSANSRFLKMAGAETVGAIRGSKPGEVLCCIFSRMNEYGCGSTRECRVCGAVQAVMECLRVGKEVVREVRLRTAGSQGEEAVNVRVSARPFLFEAQQLVIAFLEDMRAEEEHNLLERMFFHDLLNTVGGVLGTAELLRMEQGDSEFVAALRVSARQMQDEIQFYRMLSAAEECRLSVSPEPVDLDGLINDTLSLVKGHTMRFRSRVVFSPESGAVEVITDRTVLARVLVNMLKNALEASADGDLVEIGRRVEGGDVVVWVRNGQYMPEGVQLQIFRRFFSTKGKGRGIGTYSIKLLTERYLGGKAEFASAPGSGTEFRVRLPGAERSLC